MSSELQLDVRHLNRVQAPPGERLQGKGRLNCVIHA